MSAAPIPSPKGLQASTVTLIDCFMSAATLPPRIQSLRLRICFSHPCSRGAPLLAAASQAGLFFCDARQECLATSGPKMRSRNSPANIDCCRSAATLPPAHSHCDFASAFRTPAFDVRTCLLQQVKVVFSSVMQGRNVLLRRDPRCAAGTPPQTCLCEFLSASQFLSNLCHAISCKAHMPGIQLTSLLPSRATALRRSLCEPQGITCVGWHVHLPGSDVLRAH